MLRSGSGHAIDFIDPNQRSVVESGFMYALVVEDNRLSARDYAALLRHHGAQAVSLAGTAEEALRVAEMSLPDLALVDITLEGPLSGLVVGEALAERGVGVVYISGEIDEAVLWSRNHAVEILRKPIAESDLARAVAAVRDYLRSRGR